jgi:hypothetical protein
MLKLERLSFKLVEAINRCNQILISNPAELSAPLTPPSGCPWHQPLLNSPSRLYINYYKCIVIILDKINKIIISLFYVIFSMNMHR